MRSAITIAVLLFASLAANAQAAKPCDDLKAEIAKKMEANGVKTYSLEIVAKDNADTEAKVVGTCEGGTKKILYRKTAGVPKTQPQTPAPAPTSKP